MKTPLESVHEYYAAFSTLDLRAIVSCYSEPSMNVSPQGVFAAPDRTALAGFLGPLLESLRAKGYGRSEFIQPVVTMLGASDAVVQGIAIRYTATASEMERIPLSYLMHRADAGWKIAVLIVEH